MEGWLQEGTRCVLEVRTPDDPTASSNRQESGGEDGGDTLEKDPLCRGPILPTSPIPGAVQYYENQCLDALNKY